MSEPASISNGIAGRYASALFELAKEEKTLPALEKDVATLAEAKDASPDLAMLISSPLYSRDEMKGAISAVAEKLGLGVSLANTMALMAQNRRLFVVPHFLTALQDRIAEDKGEMTAEVVSASAMTKTQEKKLVDLLKAKVGKDVKVNASVDESLIGGMIVKVGSKMIDTSIKSKLAALQNTMKEVG